MTWSVANYNTNPSLNTAINGTDISENCSASGYDDALRQIMADIAAWTNAYAVTYPIAVNKGGTGSTTAGGALTNLGALSSSYQRLPQTSEGASFNYSTAMDGGHVRYTGGVNNIGIPTVATAGWQIGATILTVNDGSGSMNIIPVTGVTLVWAAGAATGTRVLAVGGMATMVMVATDRWFISGTGLT